MQKGITMISRCLRVFLTILLFGVTAEAVADLGLQFGVESFRWREFDAAGARLLEETGPRYHLGANWQKPFGADRHFLLDVRGSIYYGNVDYDGQACTQSGLCSPFMSDTVYSGVAADATIARRFGQGSGGEVFVGAGVDSWRRDIEGRGNVRGAIEDWATLYVLAGGGAYWSAPSVRIHARAGIKYPIYTEELPDSYDVVLEPKGRTSWFARLSTDFLGASRPLWGLGVFYDSYRFAESDKERSGSVLIWQPKSDQDVAGIFATIYLR